MQLDRARSILPECAPGALLAIGGLSRSGKGTWASIFREVLAERGRSAVVISLDAWLRSEAEREPGHVLGRFDTEAIVEVVGRLSDRASRLDLSLGHYDRYTRQHEADARTVGIDPEDVVIFEGVPALLVEELVAACSSTFYVDCPEGVRRERFDREYRIRGVSDSEIEALYRTRESDEHPIIKKSAAVADISIGSAP